MYKMIVVDLDGTLLNDYKKVSEENLIQQENLFIKFLFLMKKY